MGKRLRRGFFWRGGVIWVRTDPLDRRPRSTGARDAEAAYLWRAERERVRASPGYAASLAASFGSWVEKMIDLKTEQRSAGTANMYGVKLGHFVRLWGPETSLASVTAERVDAYVRQRRSEGVKNNTIARELSCLRQLLRHAKRARQYPLELAEVMPIGFSAEYVPVTRTLKLEHLPLLWRALRNDTERAFVALAIAVGADHGDIERALPEDYDAERGVMRVRGTKTDVRDAEVPVLAHVRPLVEFAVARLPLTWSRSSHGVADACKRAGIPPLSPKDLRRTAASWLIAAGAAQTLVGRFLRHRSDAMVRKVYGQVTPTELGSLLRASAETLQTAHGPLAEQADAGDLKGAAASAVSTAPARQTRTYGPGELSLRAAGGAVSLQPGAEMLALAAECLFSAQRARTERLRPRGA